MSLVRFRDYPWGDDLSTMKEVTCVNHPTARYLTKNPAMRGLHFIEAPEGFGWGQECPCPWDDLRVRVEDSEAEAYATLGSD